MYSKYMGLLEGIDLRIDKEFTNESFRQTVRSFLKQFKSLETRYNYLLDLIAFEEYLTNSEGLKLFNYEKITRDHINGFRDFLVESYAPATLHRRIASVTSFLGELVELKAIPNNPAKGIRKHVSRSLRPSNGFSNDEVKELLESFDEEDARQLMWKCLYSTLFYHGLRVSEALKLRVSDIQTVQQETAFIVHGKGSKYREIPIHEETLKLLDSFLENYPREKDGFIFAHSNKSLQAKAGRIVRAFSKPVSRDAVHKNMKSTLLKLGMDIDRSTHSTRKTTISALFEQGVQDHKIQTLAGHSNPETTLRYKVREDRLAESAVKSIKF